MTLLKWAWLRPNRLERDFAVVAAGYAMALGSAQCIGETQDGAPRFGGAPVMLATMREFLVGLERVK